MAVSGVLVAVGLLGAGSHAQASDFWDEVKTPGLRQWRRHVADAREAASAGRWPAVLSEAERAIERLDERAPAHVLRGRALGELNRPEEAVAAFERALELSETALDGTEAGSHAALLAAGAGAWELAARILPRVLGRMRVNSQRHDLYALYGDVLMTLGPARLREAVVAYREAVRQGGRGHVRANVGLALALRRAGELLESGDLAREAGRRGRLSSVLSAIPVPEAERAARRAVVHEALGNREEARVGWREAATFEPWRAHAEEQLATMGTPVRRSR
jgi:tetratricopeptide (TPR) repeat protein